MLNLNRWRLRSRVLAGFALVMVLLGGVHSLPGSLAGAAAFTWLQDELIGKLPIEWNWLPDEFGSNEEAKLLHYTLGTPCFHEYANTSMGSEWHLERMLMNYSVQN